MDSKRNKTSYITAFLREFAAIFTFIILSMSLAGNFIIGYVGIQNFPTSAIGLAGLPYSTVLQSVGFSLIMALISGIMRSEYIAAKVRFIWRSLLYFFATLLIASIFAIIHKWIPTDNLQVWLVFFLFFFVFFLAAIGLSFAVLKVEDRKYNKLLERYKKKYED